jgi:hypothetical protein
MDITGIRTEDTADTLISDIPVHIARPAPTQQRPRNQWVRAELAAHPNRLAALILAAVITGLIATLTGAGPARNATTAPATTLIPAATRAVQAAPTSRIGAPTRHPRRHIPAPRRSLVRVVVPHPATSGPSPSPTLRRSPSPTPTSSPSPESPPT